MSVNTYLERIGKNDNCKECVFNGWKCSGGITVDGCGNPIEPFCCSISDDEAKMSVKKFVKMLMDQEAKEEALELLAQTRFKLYIVLQDYLVEKAKSISYEELQKESFVTAVQVVSPNVFDFSNYGYASTHVDTLSMSQLNDIKTLVRLYGI